ncbi:MAG: aldose epimerase family protein [Terrimicrobiaceae bacterium]
MHTDPYLRRGEKNGVSSRLFGNLPDGGAARLFTLSNGSGLACDITEYGGILTALRVARPEGSVVDVVLGFNTLEGYLKPHPYFGTIVGRVAGRISGAKFQLDGREYPLAANNAPNHLHGGPGGFDKKLWQAEVPENESEPSLRLSYLSPDGEEGYPGNVRVTVVYSLTEKNELVIRYEAESDQATPLSLTNHSYFNLAGEGSGDVGGQVLQIFSDEIAATDEAMTLLGTRVPVASQQNDFNQPRRLSDAIPGLLNQHGDNYFIRRSASGELVPAAILKDPASGLTMTTLTTQDCVQLYSASFLDGTLLGKSGVRYAKHAGLCLECQTCPAAVHDPALGNIILRPGERYDHMTRYAFSFSN